MNQSYSEALELLRRATLKMEDAGDVLLVAMIGDVIDVMVRHGSALADGAD